MQEKELINSEEFLDYWNDVERLKSRSAFYIHVKHGSLYQIDRRFLTTIKKNTVFDSHELFKKDLGELRFVEERFSDWWEPADLAKPIAAKTIERSILQAKPISFKKALIISSALERAKLEADIDYGDLSIIPSIFVLRHNLNWLDTSSRIRNLIAISKEIGGASGLRARLVVEALRGFAIPYRIATTIINTATVLLNETDFNAGIGVIGKNFPIHRMSSFEPPRDFPTHPKDGDDNR